MVTLPDITTLKTYKSGTSIVEAQGIVKSDNFGNFFLDGDYKGKKY